MKTRVEEISINSVIFTEVTGKLSQVMGTIFGMVSESACEIDDHHISDIVSIEYREVSVKNAETNKSELKIVVDNLVSLSPFISMLWDLKPKLLECNTYVTIVYLNQSNLLYCRDFTIEHDYNIPF